jgi:hypothetical protein
MPGWRFRPGSTPPSTTHSPKPVEAFATCKPSMSSRSDFAATSLTNGERSFESRFSSTTSGTNGYPPSVAG